MVNGVRIGVLWCVQITEFVSHFAPALATRAAQIVCGGANFPELMDAHSGERAFA